MIPIGEVIIEWGKGQSITINGPLQTKDGRADMTNWEMDLFDTRCSSYQTDPKDSTDECCKNSLIKPACLPITILGESGVDGLMMHSPYSSSADCHPLSAPLQRR